MNDILQTWTPQPVVPSTKKNTFLTPTLFLGALFVCLILISVPTLYLLQTSNRTRLNAAPTLDVTPLLANCVFFFQVCPTSSKGIAQQQTVSELLFDAQSPLATVGPILHPQLDQPITVETTPDQILTLIATKNNINPLVLLTLSEISEQTVTVASTVNQTIENGGDRSAWFSIQHQQMAKELIDLAQQYQLDPGRTDETYPKDSIKVGMLDVEINSEISLASGVILEYLAAHSTSVDDLNQKLAAFVPTYQKLFGIDPSLTLEAL